MALRRLRLCQADPAVFGIGEAAAGDDVVSDVRGRSAARRSWRRAPFVPCRLHQHRMAVDVADGEDVADVRPQVLIDGDHARFGADPGRLQVQLAGLAGQPTAKNTASAAACPVARRRTVIDADRPAAPAQAGDEGARGAWSCPGPRNARPSSVDTSWSAAGTRTGPPSNTVTAAPRSAKMDAIWQPVSAPPITATRPAGWPATGCPRR